MLTALDTLTKIIERSIWFLEKLEVFRPVTRAFCPECGTHITNRTPGFPAVVIKVGTLDNPGLLGGPDSAIFTIDKQALYQIPQGIPSFERLPG
jgi:hypothetical protein